MCALKLKSILVVVVVVLKKSRSRPREGQEGFTVQLLSCTTMVFLMSRHVMAVNVMVICVS